MEARMEHFWKILEIVLLLITSSSISAAAYVAKNTEEVPPSKVTKIFVETNAAFYRPGFRSSPSFGWSHTETPEFQTSTETKLSTFPQNIHPKKYLPSTLGPSTSEKVSQTVSHEDFYTPTRDKTEFIDKDDIFETLDHFTANLPKTEDSNSGVSTDGPSSFQDSSTVHTSRKDMTSFTPSHITTSATSTQPTTQKSETVNGFENTVIVPLTTRNNYKGSVLTTSSMSPVKSTSSNKNISTRLVPSTNIFSSSTLRRHYSKPTSYSSSSSIPRLTSTSSSSSLSSYSSSFRPSFSPISSSSPPSIPHPFSSSSPPYSSSSSPPYSSFSSTDEATKKIVIVTEKRPSRKEVFHPTTPSKIYKHLSGKETSVAVESSETNKKSGEAKNERKRKKKKKNRKNRRNKKEKRKENKIDQIEKEQSQRSSVDKRNYPVIPVHYVLRLQPELSHNYTVRGVVEIELEVREPTYKLRLHSSNIDVKKSSIEVTLMKTHKSVPIKSARLNSKGQKMSIKLGRRLKPGRAYILHMEFAYRLKREGKGFYRRPYLDQNGARKWIAVTQFWPSGARRAFPCFDDPDIRATFDVHIAHIARSKAISNMPIVRSYRIEKYPDLVWDQFATTPKIPAHLLSFAITDFSHTRNDEESDFLIRVWAREEISNRTKEALRFINQTLNFFEEFFGKKFSLPKLDVLALPPSVPYPIRGWGLFSFRETILPSSEMPDHESIIEMASIISREVAQQWLGTLVTFNELDDQWLVGSFATFLSQLALDEIEPSWGLLSEFVINYLQKSLENDDRTISLPESGNLEGSEKIKKGVSLIHMTQHFLAAETFKKGLQNFFKRFSYKSATQDDLWEAMNEAAGEDRSLPVGVTLKPIINTWQHQSGYPVIDVIRNDNTSATLSQRRFQTGLNAGAPGNCTWWVPITFTSEDRASFRHTRAQTWLREGVPTLRVTGLPSIDRWVIFNLQSTGYYRINYDVTTWKLLIEQVKKDLNVIHVANRAQLIDDSLKLAKTGDLSYSHAFELLTYLRFENDVIPWISALKNIRYINLMLRKTKDYGPFKKFVFSLMDPLIGSIGIEAVQKDSVQKNHLREILKQSACQMGHPICIQKAGEFFKNWRNRTSFFRYEESFDYLTVCIGIREGDEEMWNFFWDISQRTKDKESRTALLKALACTKHVWILTRYLQAIGEPSLSFLRDDLIRIYEASLDTAVGDYVTWEVFRISWDNFKNNSDFVNNIAPEIVEVLTAGFNTQHQLKELEAFNARITDELPTSMSTALNESLRKARIMTQMNIQWSKDCYDSIIRWLSDNGFTANLLNLQFNLTS